VPNDDRRHGGEILLIEAQDFLVPALFPSASIERDQVIIGCEKEQVISPHSHTAIADVRATSRLPEVMPEFVPVACVQRPGVVWGGVSRDGAPLSAGGGRFVCGGAWRQGSPFPPPRR